MYAEFLNWVKKNRHLLDKLLSSPCRSTRIIYMLGHKSKSSPDITYLYYGIFDTKTKKNDYECSTAIRKKKHAA